MSFPPKMKYFHFISTDFYYRSFIFQPIFIMNTPS